LTKLKNEKSGIKRFPSIKGDDHLRCFLISQGHAGTGHFPRKLYDGSRHNENHFDTLVKNYNHA
jgi:hypothetical protein